MASTVHTVTIDSADPYALGSWWAQVLDRPLADDDEPGDPEVLIAVDTGTDLLFQQVPEGKGGKNRLHLDLRPTDRPRDAEVERVLDLGATQLADLRNPDGTGWVVLADPEGNEFCVLRSAAERGEE